MIICMVIMTCLETWSLLSRVCLVSLQELQIKWLGGGLSTTWVSPKK